MDQTVIMLRAWGSEHVHSLTGPGVDSYTIGSAATSAIHLTDDTGLISRTHARIFRVPTGWRAEDMGSKNGIRQDAVRRLAFDLFAGTELGIGKMTLIAESRQLSALRSYLARILGWDSAHAVTVDLAIRAIRMAATERQPLLLAGDDDLVAVARQLHLRTLGPAAPFVLCDAAPADPDALDTPPGLIDAPPNFATALALGEGGTVCVRAERVPSDFRDGSIAARSPDARVNLIVCARAPSPLLTRVASTIVVPDLGDRRADLARIVYEYALDAAEELAIDYGFVREADRAWVVAQAPSSFGEIETMTRRVVSLREAGNPHRAAPRLGLTHAGLMKWVKRTGFKV